MHSTGATFGMNAPHETASTSHPKISAARQVVTHMPSPVSGRVMQRRPGRHSALSVHGVPKHTLFVHGVPKHAVGTGAGSPVLLLPSPPPDPSPLDASEVELEPALVLA